MPSIETMRNDIDEYFSERPASDSYDEVDATYELVHAMNEAELFELAQQHGIWHALLRETISTEAVGENIQKILVDIIVAEILY